MSRIVRQVDPSYEGDDFVAMIYEDEVWLKIRGQEHTDNCGGYTYGVGLHPRRGSHNNGVPVKSCPHQHRSIDAAVRCAKKLLKLHR